MRYKEGLQMFSLAQMIAVSVISFLGGMLVFMIGIVCIAERKGWK